jgi:hypothetical protein
MIVDPNCPTIRDKPASRYTRYSGDNLQSVKNAMRIWDIQTVLVTPTNPVKMVIVFETYPRMDASYVSMTREDFDEFRYVLCDPNKRAKEERQDQLAQGRVLMIDKMVFDGHPFEYESISGEHPLLNYGVPKDYASNLKEFIEMVNAFNPQKIMVDSSDPPVVVVVMTRGIEPCQVCRVKMTLTTFLLFGDLCRYDDCVNWRKEGF